MNKIYSALITILFFISLFANIYIGYKSINLATKLASVERAETVINQNYYSLLAWNKSYFQKIKGSSKSGGFFNRLFTKENPVPDFSIWSDPYNEIPVEDR